ncbi:unnamed protein product [Cuscuta epithymum]|uniref:Uncharacterized protein n=1 Tax=Cuscuta epithymum TaxID=186058 RepID=A0AAV0D5T0_9ASTE|nr:unnamed protein product [Cuscuta epithymum]
MATATASLSATTQPSSPASTGISAPISLSSIGAPSSLGTQPFVIMPCTATLSASSFASPSRSLVPNYTLFHNLPPVFLWSAPSPVQQVSLDPSPSFSAPTAAQFSGPTFVGSPRISSLVPATRLGPPTASNSPMADLA